MTYKKDVFEFFLGISAGISLIIVLTTLGYVFFGWQPLSFTTISALTVFVLPPIVLTTGVLYGYAER
jgi:hypothetical protein